MQAVTPIELDTTAAADMPAAESSHASSLGGPVLDKRDNQGRTLDQALAEDRLQRAERWSAELRRSQRPGRWIGLTVSVLVIGLFLAGLRFDLGVPRRPHYFLLAGQLTQIAYFLLYSPLIEPWMRRRHERVRAMACAEDIELPDYVPRFGHIG